MRTSCIRVSTSDISSKHLWHNGHGGSLLRLSCIFRINSLKTKLDPSTTLFFLYLKIVIMLVNVFMSYYDYLIDFIIFAITFDSFRSSSLLLKYFLPDLEFHKHCKPALLNLKINLRHDVGKFCS